jgi:hypothetical protein
MRGMKNLQCLVRSMCEGLMNTQETPNNLLQRTHAA